MTLTSSPSGVTVCTTREAHGLVPGDGSTLAWGYWPGHGQPVIALHGITASYLNFAGIADRLAGRRPLLAFDLRGRGDSDFPPAGPFGMSQHAADVAAAMRQFGLMGAVVIGHSMGAYVAVALAAEHPQLVDGLVLVDGGLPLGAPPGVAPETLLDTVLAAQMARLRASFDSPQAYLDFWRALPCFAGDRWNEWVERYLRYDLAGQPPALRSKVAETAVRADFLDSLALDRLQDRLRAVAVPTLLLRASEGFDPGTPPLLTDEVARQAGRWLRDVTDRVVAGTTHYTIALGPKGASAVADAVVDWAGRCGR